MKYFIMLSLFLVSSVWGQDDYYYDEYQYGGYDYEDLAEPEVQLLQPLEVDPLIAATTSPFITVDEEQLLINLRNVMTLGGTIEDSDANGNTPLMFAASQGYAGAVQ